METTDKRIELIQKITTMEIWEVRSLLNILEVEMKGKEPAKQWPQPRDIVYELMSTGQVIEKVWQNSPHDNRLLKCGFIFRTYEECIKVNNRNILIQELKEFAGDQSWVDWDNINQPKHYIYFCNKSKSWDWEIVHLTQIIGQTYYKSKTSAEKAITYFGERLNLLK